MKQTNIKLHVVLLLILLAVISSIQYKAFQSVDTGQYQKVHSKLNHIIRLDAVSEENMMLLQNHKTGNYDQLTENILALKKDMMQLQALLAEQAELAEVVQQLETSVNVQIRAANQFKGELGILVNSERYLPTLIKQNINQYPAYHNMLLHLKGDVFELLSFPDNQPLHDRIVTQASQISLPHTKMLRKHINILLQYAPLVQSRINTVINCGIPENIYRLSSAFDAIHNKKIEQSQFSRMVLMALVAFLSLYILMLLYSLFRSGERLGDELEKQKVSEENHRKLVDASSAAIMTLANNKFVSANTATLRMFGLDKESDFFQMCPADASPEFQANGQASSEAALAYIQYALQHGSCAFEWLYLRMDGEVFPTHVQLTAICMDKEKVLQAVVTDLTDLHRLRKEKDRMVAAVESTDQAVLITDTQARILYVNKAFTYLTGYTFDDAVGQYASILRSKSVDDDIYHRMIQTLNEGKSWSGVLNVCDKEGHDILSKRSISPIFNHAGDVIEHVVFLHDIRSEQEEATKLEHTQRLESLGILAGGIAHDFNNILTAIVGNAALAERKLPPTSPVKDKLMKIEEAAQRAAELCKQMLAYSGKGSFIIQAVDISQQVEAMMHLMEVSIEKNVVIKYHLAKALPTVEVDSAQIQQVILNLITNANEAIADKSGVISLSSGVMHADRAYLHASFCGDEAPEGRYVYIEVSDTGCGMSADTMEKIFDPFFTTKFTGRGLGMSATLGIVRGHHGALRVYSEVGQGSTFKVLLPASKNSLDSVEKIELEEHGAFKAIGTVLIVDDEDTIREVASMMLEDLGYTTLSAENGQDAIEVYQAHQDDITAVLLDMTMPKMDGKACFRELRRINADVKVVLSSGYSEEDATARFNGKGLAGFIQKPYSPEQLAMIMGDKVMGQA